MRTTREILEAANAVKDIPAGLSTEQKRLALNKMASALIENKAEILCANALDVQAAKGNVTDVMIDRLRLTDERIDSMAQGIIEVAALADPVGKVCERIERPNGLIIEKTQCAMGVIAIIFESRPNVTSDAAALSLMSGSVCVLRGGKEAYRSCKAITDALRKGLESIELSPDLINLVDDTTRASAAELMTAVGKVDLLIPRGGAGLIRACTENARVPCIQTGTGICHIYVDQTADFDEALNIIENAKTSRPSVCNAEEVCLVHKSIADKFLPKLRERLTVMQSEKGNASVELRLDSRAAQIIDGTPASDSDFDTEFLDYILAVGVVDSLDAAIKHIARHSTGHSEAILTRCNESAEEFVRRVDSAAVYVNASTRFTDGGEFGLGCEMGISTQRLHARGPMGLNELCTYKYVIRGKGQIR